MAGISIKAGFDHPTAIARHLMALAVLDAKHFESVRREIGEYLVGDVQDNFDSQRLFDGRPMPQSKAAIKRKGKTLIRKHHLYDSYAYQLADNTTEVGSDSVYANIHHHGGETGRPGHRFVMVERPVLGIAARQEKRLGDFMVAEIRAAGGQP